MPISWITYAGKKILFGDYSNLKAGEALSLLQESEGELRKLRAPTPMLLDLTGCFLDQAFVAEMKRIAKQYDNVIHRSASVGVTGVKKVLGLAITTFAGNKDKTGYFDSLEEGKAWLVD